jgi:hypothetical protein
MIGADTDKFNINGNYTILKNLSSEHVMHADDQKSYWIEQPSHELTRYKKLIYNLDLIIKFEGEELDTPIVDINNQVICEGIHIIYSLRSKSWILSFT